MAASLTRASRYTVMAAAGELQQNCRFGATHIRRWQLRRAISATPARQLPGHLRPTDS